MSRKDEHIRKYLQAPLPEPEVPADDAWAGMSDMLGASAPTPAPDPGPATHFLKAIAKFKGLLIAVSTVATSAMIGYIVYKAELPAGDAGRPVSVVHDDADRRDSVGADLARRDLADAELAGADSAGAVRTHPAGERNADEDSPANAARSKNHEIKPGSSETVARVAPARRPSNSPHGRAGNAEASAKYEANEVKAEKQGGSTRNNALEQAYARNSAGSGRSVSIAKNGGNSKLGNGGNSTGINGGNFSQKTGADQSRIASFSQKTTPLIPLTPLPPHFKCTEIDFAKYIQKPAVTTANPSPKTRRPVLTNFHFGPEWSVTRSLAATDYLFTGADSVSHPLRIAIPGVFVSKSWNRHSATLIFNPLHAYFGEKALVAQRVDTVRVTDSLFHTIRHNTNFLKAFGLNFSLQYQYQATRWISLAGGVSYARYSSALLRRQTGYSTGTDIEESHLTVKGREGLKSYIRPQQWNVRAGVLLHAPQVLQNRLQLGWTVIMPVSNLSINGFKSVKSPNMQLYLRFLVK